MAAPLCNTCKQPIKFELLKNDQGEPIPKVDEDGEPILRKDGTPAYRMRPVNVDGSRHECKPATAASFHGEVKAATSQQHYEPLLGEATIQQIFAEIEKRLRGSS